MWMCHVVWQWKSGQYQLKSRANLSRHNSMAVTLQFNDVASQIHDRQSRHKSINEACDWVTSQINESNVTIQWTSRHASMNILSHNNESQCATHCNTLHQTATSMNIMLHIISIRVISRFYIAVQRVAAWANTRVFLYGDKRGVVTHAHTHTHTCIRHVKYNSSHINESYTTYQWKSHYESIQVIPRFYIALQPIPHGVTISNAASKLKAQSSNVSFATFQ